MKVLVLLVVGVLVCSLTGAQTVSKCQLMDKLRAAINNPPNATRAELAEENLQVARIVCRVAHGSKFNTSIVTELIQKSRRRNDRSAHQDSSRNEDHSNRTHFEENNHENSSHQGRDDDHHRHRRDASQHHDNEQGDHNVTHGVQNDRGNSSKPQESDDQHHQDHGNSEHKHRSRRHAAHYENYQNVTLYGILQLPECTCRNSMNTSENICGIDCSRLTDGNIDDDISCFFKIFPDHKGHHSREKQEDDHSREKQEDEQCASNCPDPEVCEFVRAADYIGGCPTA